MSDEKELNELVRARVGAAPVDDEGVRSVLTAEIGTFPQPTDEHAVWWNGRTWSQAEAWSADVRRRIASLDASLDDQSRDDGWRLISRAEVFKLLGERLAQHEMDVAHGLRCEPARVAAGLLPALSAQGRVEQRSSSVSFANGRRPRAGATCRSMLRRLESYVLVRSRDFWTGSHRSGQVLGDREPLGRNGLAVALAADQVRQHPLGVVGGLTTR